jgi:hypothetical protein
MGESDDPDSWRDAERQIQQAAAVQAAPSQLGHSTVVSIKSKKKPKPAETETIEADQNRDEGRKKAGKRKAESGGEGRDGREPKKHQLNSQHKTKRPKTKTQSKSKV